MDVTKYQDKPDATAVLFKNFSDEDFAGKWDGISYPFKAGQEVYLEAFKAKHFCKHLVDREIQKLTKLDATGKKVYRTVNDPMRRELEAKALPYEAMETEPEEEESKVSTEIDPSQSVMNKNKQLEKEEKVEKPVKQKPKDLSALRDIYESLHPEGKKPFPGWKEDILLAKIADLKAGKIGDAESEFEGN